MHFTNHDTLAGPKVGQIRGSSTVLITSSKMANIHMIKFTVYTIQRRRKKILSGGTIKVIANSILHIMTYRNPSSNPSKSPCPIAHTFLALIMGTYAAMVCVAGLHL